MVVSSHRVSIRQCSTTRKHSMGVKGSPVTRRSERTPKGTWPKLHGLRLLTTWALRSFIVFSPDHQQVTELNLVSVVPAVVCWCRGRSDHLTFGRVVDGRVVSRSFPGDLIVYHPVQSVAVDRCLLVDRPGNCRIGPKKVRDGLTSGASSNSSFSGSCHVLFRAVSLV
jgi:hypothetical protein